ncbi:hypothetical protein F66182_4347 [Fusarium sp. NRRL 66182]|nr:hypothetical protein F66182_4347 [Fusarium sp. NRRL 66182]
MTALPLQPNSISSPSPSPWSSPQAPAPSETPQPPLTGDSTPALAPNNHSTAPLEIAAGSSSSSGAAREATTKTGTRGGRESIAGPSRNPVARPFDGEDESDSDDYDIEMEPIAGHRRRRSSQINMVGRPARPAGSPSRLRVTSRGPVPAGSMDEPKISEEDIDANGFAVRKDESADDSFSDEDLHDDEETGLTRKDKQKRQKKRNRNTQLDQRIARDRGDISTEERKEADKTVFRSLLVNVVLILLWYLFSLSISIYNKWMFDHDRLNFAFPLFTTSMHMVVQFVLSSLVLYFVPSLRPGYGVHQSDLGRSRHDDEPKSYGMTKLFYLTRIGPCGAATGLDIGLGNTSLKFISLTFYTMCKSSSLAFVLIFAFLFRLETPTWRLVAIIATMTLGVVLMVFGEVEFELGGFVLVISAAFFSGFRWGLTQILLLRNPATSNPFSSIFFLTPVMFLVLICLAVPVEGIGKLIDGYRVLGDEWGYVMAPLFLLFPGCIAFCMTASEFALLQRTSVVTLSIAGIFKEVVTISAAALVFGDRLTPINFVGLLTTMAAIAAYNYIKIAKMREEARDSVHGRHLADEDEPDSPSGQTDGVIDRDGDTDAENTGLLRDSIDRLDIDMQSSVASNERR